MTPERGNRRSSGWPGTRILGLALLLLAPALPAAAQPSALGPAPEAPARALVPEAPPAPPPDSAEPPPADEAPPAAASPLTPGPDRSLDAYRMPLELLAERSIGRASRRVRYDWRRGLVQLGPLGGLPAELNNYDSLRAGGFARVPYGNFLLEASLAYVWVFGSESSDRLALTPYRQPGRPDRFELDLSAGFAVAEGVVTPVPGLLPAAQLVLNAQALFRYRIYPSAFADLGLKDTLLAIVSGSLSDTEVENLEDERLAGMQIDPARYELLVGLSTDVYFQSGLFFSYRLLVATPLLAFMTETALPFGLELDLAAGLAF